MSAVEIIEQIKALPHEEQRKVFEFMRDASGSESALRIRFATDAQAREASAAVVEQFPEVFRRLAQ
jgi:hypothetical protein